MAEFKPAQMPDRTDATRNVRRIAEAAHRLNTAIEEAVRSGYSVELVRVSRCHDGAGNWGDQMVPIIRDRQEPK
ncbi:MAG TPA: hypothetical protein VG983_01500 [Caulobacterales bacterium]|jgi:hypothetical protein|nr:hypothetical protein [Caulobacterales bacterium]